MTNTDVMLYGKQQPQATELEEIVLGAMLLESESVMKVLSILKAEMFYVQKHQLIFQSVKQLFEQHKPIDIATVTEQLRFNNQLEIIGGAYEIAELTNRIGSTANVEYHSRIIYQKYLSRELIRINSAVINTTYADTVDIHELIDTTVKEIIALQDIEATPDTTPANRLNKAFEQIKLAMQTKDVVTGIKSGLYSIDRITGGWQKQDLIIVAARPGAGKSALAIHFGEYSEVPTMMFSLEMSDTQIAMREVAMEAHLKYSKLRKGEVENNEYVFARDAGKRINERKFYIDSSSKLSISILRTKLTKAIFEKGIKLLVIDYLNLMEGEQNRNQTTADKISEICKDLKRMAKQFDIPIILLAQLNRDVEKEADKKPQLHHLKSSGAIEEYADIVLLLYRPAYYKKENCDEPNALYIDIAKHKQGGTGVVNVWCEIEKNIIKDL